MNGGLDFKDLIRIFILVVNFSLYHCFDSYVFICVCYRCLY